MKSIEEINKKIVEMKQKIDKIFEENPEELTDHKMFEINYCKAFIVALQWILLENKEN